MSDGPFYPYIGLLILSGVLLAVMAAAGFGQARGARLVDALFAAGFLGYAAYLWIANPDTVEIFFYAFAVPVFAVINVVRSRRHRRGAPAPAPMGYAGPATQPYGGFPPAPVGYPAAPGYPPPDVPDLPQQTSPGYPHQAPLSPAAPAYPQQAPSSSAAPGYPLQAPSSSGAPGYPHEAPLSPAAPGYPQQAPLSPAAPGHARQAAAFAPPAAGPGQPEGFSSAATLFAPPRQEVRPEVPAVDPGSYRSMPSGLAGHDVHEQALPSARPSGLPAARQETFPMAPTAPGTSPSGLPRRVPTYSEPAPAHVEFTQRLVHPGPAPVPDEPAGPQPLYPAYPAPAPAVDAEPWRSDLTQQFQATPAGPFEQPFGEHPAQRGQAPEPMRAQDQFEQAQAGQAAPEQPRGRHGYNGPAEQTGRHVYQDDEPTGGHHWRQDPEPFDQPAYYPAHGEQQPGDGVYGSPAYPRAPGRHEQQENHPADWPPFPR